MHFCRICRTESNLKYTTKQLRHIYKRQRTEEHKQLLNTTPTLGNICHDCEERLQNFHHLSDDDEDLLLDGGEDSSEVDVDGISVISGRSRATTIGSQRREESPVIVDDDEMLYNLFFQREEQRRKVKCGKAGTEQRQRLQVAPGEDGRGPLIGSRKLTQHTLGSDGNTEIIEVLTSRENTPTPVLLATSAKPLILPNLVGLPAAHNVVAVIDLETEDDPVRQALESDDEQIVFRSVEPNLIGSNTKASGNNKKCRKIYADRKLRLIASLSLVSSDDESESEEAKTNVTQSPTVAPSAVDKKEKQLKPPIISHPCTQCPVRLPNSESLQIHERIHTNIACPVCKLSFSASQRLVHHMRCKHRTYEGSTLTERPRCAQDSAMTIRLRYLERYTYYECQLCGRIDAVLKEHKQHVMHQHAAESKSLKDPMMKELRCPICKEKCSTQRVQLARHLLSSHKPSEYRGHLREVTHTNTYKFGTNGTAAKDRHKEMGRTARIFQFTKRRNCFFECRACAKVMAGYLKYMQHLKMHQMETEDGGSTTSTTSTTTSPAKAPPPTQPLKKTKLNKTKTDKKSKEKPKAASTINNKSQPQTNLNHNNKKPNHTSKSSAGVAPVAVAAAAHLKKQKQRNKLSKKALQMALVKVKVKPPLRQFRTQKYKCKYCQNVFKGFYRLNLHKLAMHTGDEYWRCCECEQAFTTDAKRTQHALESHPKKNSENQNDRRQKRKRVPCNNDDSEHESVLVDENCNTASTAVVACKRARLNLSLTSWTSSTKLSTSAQLPQKTSTAGAASVSLHNWLQDLLQLQQNNSFNSSSSGNYTTNSSSHSQSQQCRYCTHLLRTTSELAAHEAVHVARQEIKLIKRCAIGSTAH